MVNNPKRKTALTLVVILCAVGLVGHLGLGIGGAIPRTLAQKSASEHRNTSEPVNSVAAAQPADSLDPPSPGADSDRRVGLEPVGLEVSKITDDIPGPISLEFGSEADRLNRIQRALSSFCTPTDKDLTLSPPGWQLSLEKPDRSGWDILPTTTRLSTEQVWEGSQGVHLAGLGPYEMRFWQAVDAQPFRGRRVEFSAMATVGPPSGFAIKLFARTLKSQSLNYPGVGSSSDLISALKPWIRYIVRIDVPMDGDVLIYGFSSSDAWIDDVHISVIGDADGSMPVTDEPINRAPMEVPAQFILPQPTNLDFEQEGIPIPNTATNSRTCKSSR